MRESENKKMEKEITLLDQLECVRREIRLRESVYPQLIKTKRMASHVAEYELKRMKAVERTLKNLVAKENGIETLF